MTEMEGEDSKLSEYRTDIVSDDLLGKIKYAKVLNFEDFSIVNFFNFLQTR
jgi:hypothetical protein